MKRFTVRYTLSDGSTIKAGGHVYQGAADTHARRLVDEATFRSRAANGALPILAAIVLDPAGEVVGRYPGAVGRLPEWTA